MFSVVFEFVIDLFHFFYEIPMIKKVTKRGLMGSIIDKTLEYYLTGISGSPLDEEYFIKYIHQNKDYFLVCDKDNLNEAVKFIKRRYKVYPRDRIMIACQEMNGKFCNDTENIKMFAGPEEDFYINTEFHVKKKHITDNNLYLLTNDFKRHIYTTNEEFVYF